VRTDEAPQRDIDAVFWRDLTNSVEVVSTIINLPLVAPYEKPQESTKEEPHTGSLHSKPPLQSIRGGLS